MAQHFLFPRNDYTKELLSKLGIMRRTCYNEAMSFNRDDRSAGGFRSGFSRGGGRGGFGRGDRPMYKATCSNCGKECEVPFRPTNGKPVYCSECFEKMGKGRSDSRGPERSDFRAPSFDQKAQLDALNAKLDKILNVLTEKAKGPEPVEGVEAVVIPEEKAPKAKKVVKKVTSKTKKATG